MRESNFLYLLVGAVSVASASQISNAKTNYANSIILQSSVRSQEDLHQLSLRRRGDKGEDRGVSKPENKERSKSGGSETSEARREARRKSKQQQRMNPIFRADENAKKREAKRKQRDEKMNSDQARAKDRYQNLKDSSQGSRDRKEDVAAAKGSKSRLSASDQFRDEGLRKSTGPTQDIDAAQQNKRARPARSPSPSVDVRHMPTIPEPSRSHIADMTRSPSPLYPIPNSHPKIDDYGFL